MTTLAPPAVDEMNPISRSVDTLVLLPRGSSERHGLVATSRLPSKDQSMVGTPVGSLPQTNQGGAFRRLPGSLSQGTTRDSARTDCRISATGKNARWPGLPTDLDAAALPVAEQSRRTGSMTV